MFWIPLIICIACLLLLKQVLTRQIAHPTHDTPDTPEPVIGTPVHTAQVVTTPSYNDKSHIAIAKQMVKSLINAGYTHRPGEQGSIMLVRQTSLDEIQGIAAEIAASNSGGETLKWVGVLDERRSVLHLGVAVNFVWCAREGGPDVEPEVVLTSL